MNKTSNFIIFGYRFLGIKPINKNNLLNYEQVAFKLLHLL